VIAASSNARSQCSQQYCCVRVTNAHNIAVCSRRMIENVAVTSFDPSVFNRTVTYVYVAVAGSRVSGDTYSLAALLHGQLMAIDLSHMPL
jgi:hypothetical protein